MYQEDRAVPRMPYRPDYSPTMPEEDVSSVFGRQQFPLAMVYTPVQKFENLYDKETALAKGTMFKDLDLPFGGKSITKGGIG